MRTTAKSSYRINEGRRLAKGDVLPFLHVDTLIAPVVLEKIVDALSRREIVGEAFARRYASPAIELSDTGVIPSRNLLSRRRSALVTDGCLAFPRRREPFRGFVPADAF